MLVIMAGLPGSGKTTLARELARRLGGTVLNKDELRAALFAPTLVEYSTEQDDFCIDIMLQAARFTFQRRPGHLLFFDGRTYSRPEQLDHVIAAAEAAAWPWHVLECVCSDATAQRRLDAEAGQHPAADRTYLLYRKLAAQRRPILRSKTVIDTEQDLEISLQVALAAIRRAVPAVT